MSKKDVIWLIVYLVFIAVIIADIAVKAPRKVREVGVDFWTDTGTGVQYIVVSDYDGNGVTFTPRLAKDGKPCTVSVGD